MTKKEMAAELRRFDGLLQRHRHLYFAVAHSSRFRTIGNGYPRAVAMAYNGDIQRAMRSTDKQVARMVVKWVQRMGLSMKKWDVARRIADGRAK